MPYPQFPEEKTGKDKQAGGGRQQAIIRLSPVQQVEQGIILDKCIGNHKGTKEQHSFSINADRIFAVFPCSVCKNVNKLQSFYGKKAQRGIKKENPAKHNGASNQHEKYGEHFSKSPINAANCKPIGKHYHSLKDAPNPAEFYAAS